MAFLLPFTDLAWLPHSCLVTPVMLRETTSGTRGWEGDGSMVQLAVSCSCFFPFTLFLCVLSPWGISALHGVAPPPLALVFPLLVSPIGSLFLSGFLFLKYAVPEVPAAWLRAWGVPMVGWLDLLPLAQGSPSLFSLRPLWSSWCQQWALAPCSQQDCTFCRLIDPQAQSHL